MYTKVHCIEVAIWNGHRSIISLTKNIPYAASQQHLLVWLIKISKIVEGTSLRHKLCPCWRCTFKEIWLPPSHHLVDFDPPSLDIFAAILLAGKQIWIKAMQPNHTRTLLKIISCVLLEYRNMSHKHLLLISFYEDSWLCLDFSLISATTSTRVLPHSR